MIKRIFWGISSFLIISACQHDQLEVDVSDVKTTTRFHRFDSAFFNLDTTNFSEGLFRLKQDYPLFFQSGATDQFWRFQRTDPRQVELYQRIKEVWGNMDEANRSLNYAMKHFYYYYPEKKDITFYTYVSNLDFQYPVLYAPENEVTFVALDLYLGQNQRYYAHLPAYLAYRRNPFFMIRDCMETLARENITPLREQEAYTLLDAMIYHGKVLYFIEAMMPEAPDWMITRYIDEHLEFCRQNERNVWAYFIENNLLFSKKDDDIRRFMDPAPFSKFGMKFDNQTPGQIGHWVGWQIVKSYHRNNSGTSLKDIFAETDSRKFLKLSAYKPE